MFSSIKANVFKYLKHKVLFLFHHNKKENSQESSNARPKLEIIGTVTMKGEDFSEVSPLVRTLRGEVKTLFPLYGLPAKTTLEDILNNPNCTFKPIKDTILTSDQVEPSQHKRFR